MNFLKPTKEQLEIQPGDKVRYCGKKGIVLKEWGVWYDKICDDQISGRGIFEVQFGDEIKSINCVWLEPL